MTPDRPQPHQPLNGGPAKPVSRLQTVHEVCETLLNQVRHLAERKSAQTHPRGLVTKLWLTLTIVSVLCTIGTVGYGTYNFSDAPIRSTSRGYISKTSRQYTASQFEAFSAWKRAMAIVFPITVVCASVLAFSDNLDQRRGSRSR